ncbi:MAG: hypothetical protein Kow006_16070 [Gammaproteobacteria bacterium]
MNACALPLIVEPDQLEPLLDDPRIRIVDLCKPEVYQQYHLPGAAHLDYGQIIQPRPPAMGLLPDAGRLSELFSTLGLTRGMQVVAYDDEGGGRAARLLWTLEAAGHPCYSLLNGGLHAWANERHPLTHEPAELQRTRYEVEIDDGPLASKEYVLERLGDRNVVLLDARSPAEYQGRKVFAARGGHIPGAVNLEWTETMDTQRNLRLKDEETLRDMLEVRGATPDKEIIVYCQTHHRSAHLYIVLKSLGYERVKAYAGSWSEWGNLPELPVE